jgi:deoxyribodipyrimidine photo-lyase
VPLSVVWFKRDLRLDDHRPLAQAAARGLLVALYVDEPSLRRAPDCDASHLAFIEDSLAALDCGLRERGIPLTRRHGEVVEVLADLHRAHPFDRLLAHEETGTRLTWDRDRAVAAWCRARGVQFVEIPQNGVVRRLASRDGWSRRWDARMREPLTPAPRHLRGPAGLLPGGPPPGPAPRRRPDAQRGGEPEALGLLDSFLDQRGVDYRTAMSSPVTAFDACSRLSPHLAWGTISLRRVSQATDARIAQVRAARGGGLAVDPRWAASLRSFSGRLRWHCHFMQKLEDEPRIEFENVARSCDGLREHALTADLAQARLGAWTAGETGYPMVDACMRALIRTGWINFRMRAMLMSFAAYHLWLHWRPVSLVLARRFLDYEPGIHYSQCQMQSGTTGINTVRIYSPGKQVLDHDPHGVFIRAELPALARVPDAFLAEPHRMPGALQREVGCVIGRDYPAPLVDHGEAWRAAREQMAAIRRRPESRAEADRVQARHGSRRSGLAQMPGRRRGRGEQAAALAQRGLWDEPNEPPEAR